MVVLQCGSDGKIVLEYSWEPVPVKEEVPPSCSTQEPVTIKTEGEEAAGPQKSGQNVTTLLQKLASLAKLLPLLKEKVRYMFDIFIVFFNSSS